MNLEARSHLFAGSQAQQQWIQILQEPLDYQQLRTNSAEIVDGFTLPASTQGTVRNLVQARSVNLSLRCCFNLRPATFQRN